MKLRVSLKKRLRDFTLEVDFTTENEVFALLGASGSGKSMTLKCIAGIETPEEGCIILDRRTLFDSTAGIDLPPQQRRVGYLFQDYALFPNMTIRENIRFVMTRGVSGKVQELQEILRRFRLEEFSEAYPSALSGGQQQRAALARILASDAELLLLDEPFSALDSYLKWQLELELMDLLPAYSGAAVLVSHDRGEVYRLADRVAVMNRGKLETTADKTELFHQPQTLAATLLTGCKNVSPAKKTAESCIFAGDWQLSLKTAQPVADQVKYVGIRAHSLQFAEASCPEVNTFPVEVVRVVEDAFSFIIMVRLAGSSALPLRWELTKTEWEEVRDKLLYLHFPPEHIMLLEA